MSLAVNLNKLPTYVKESAYFKQQESKTKEKSSPTGVVPFRFPSTKNILWNRSPTGPPTVIHLTQKKDISIHLVEKTLQLAHRHAKQISRLPYHCFLLASVNIDSSEGVTVTVDRFDPGRDLPGRPGRVTTAQLPGDHIIPLATTFNPQGIPSSSVEHYISTFKLLQHHCSSKDSIDINRFLTLKAFCCCYDNDEDVTFNLHMVGVTMATEFDVMPINPVPIIPTALARNLSGPLSLSDVQGTPKSGYITMDQTRKLLLLLESDPKVYNLPLVGIWLSGVTSIQNPYVWASCLRYMFNSSIQERVCSASQGFLLVLYSPTHVNPEFYECTAKQDNLQFQIHSCEENLHFFKYADNTCRPPTQLDLQPTVDGQHHSVFVEAVKQMPQIESSPALPPEIQLQRMFPGSANNSMEEEEEANSSMPRPSPSPHPLGDKHAPSVQPSVPELSFILDDSFFEHVPETGNSHSTPAKQTPSRNRPKPDMNAQENSPYQLNRNKNQLITPRQAPIKPSPGRTSRPGPLRPLNMDINQINSMPPSPAILSPPAMMQRGVPPRAMMSPRQNRGMTPPPASKQGPPQPQQQMNYQQQQQFSGQPSMNYQQPPQQQQGQSRNYQQPPAQMNYRPPVTAPPQSHSGNYTTGTNGQNFGGYRPPVNPRMQVNGPVINNSGNRYPPPSPSPMNANTARPNMPQRPTVRPGSNQYMHPNTATNQLPPQPNTYNNTGLNPVMQKPFRAQPNPTQGHYGNVSPPQPVRNSPPQRVTPPRGRPPTPTVLSNGEVRMPNNHYQYQVSQQRQYSPPKEQGSRNGSPPTHTPTRRRDSTGSESTLSPDAYHLLMQQDKQLKLLQAQIQLLLQAQAKYDTKSLPSNPSCSTLTPPVSPASISSPGAFHKGPFHRPSTMDMATSPMSAYPRHRMTTMSTNTGPSLLMSPVSSQATMDTTLSALSDTSTQITSRMFDISGTFALPNTQEQTESVVSPIVALDLQSFADSSPHQRTNELSTGCFNSSSMQLDNSLQGPVLGESVSMHMQQQRVLEKQQRMREEEKSTFKETKPGTENSLLIKDEKKFYEQVLGQVNQLLQKSEDTSSDKLDDSKCSLKTMDSHSSHSKSSCNCSMDIQTPNKSDLSKLGMSYDDSDLLIPTKGSPEMNRFSSVIGDYIPRINYTSFSEATMNSTDLSFEANAIAMKYLSDKQLSKLSHHMGQQRPTTTQENLLQTVLTKASTDKTLLGSSSCDSSPVNMSIASKKYLEKYGLLEKSSTCSTIEEVSLCQRCGEEVKDSPRHNRKCYSPPSRDTSCRTLSSTQELGMQSQSPNTNRELSFSQISNRTSSSQSSSSSSDCNVLDLKKIREMPKLL
ncbi:SCL-interrupting locus protein homolog [Glandiceps talaboti]